MNAQSISSALYTTDKLMGKVFLPAARLCMAMGVLAVIGIAVPIIIDVLGRFFFSKPLPGTMEVAEMLIAVVGLSAISYIQMQDTHISVDIFYQKFSPSVRSAVDVVMWGSGTGMLAITFSFATTYALNKYGAGEESMSLGLPVWAVCLYIALCIGLFSVSLFRSFLCALARAVDQRHWLSLAVGFALMLLVLCIPALARAMEMNLSKPVAGICFMLYLFVLLFMGMPIGVSMFIAGFQGLLVIMPRALGAYNVLGMVPYSNAASFVLTVIPMFILMGELTLCTGISTDLFRTASVWLGRLPGGLGVATLGGCAGFAAVCGDSLATAVTMSSVALPEMRAKKYDPPLACALLASGGTLGILIPPSVGFIFYAIMTEESVGKLFMAGVIPGILLTLILMAIVVGLALLKPEWAPRGPATTWAEKVHSLWGVLPMVGLVTLIMGGMLGGVFSPTEGGAMGVLGTVLYGLITRRLTWAFFIQAVRSTSLITCKILLIMVAVGVLGYFLAASQLPAYLTNLALSTGANRYVVLTLVILLFLVLGCLMNVIPMLMLTMPTIFPVIVALGFDPIWFGVISVILMELGQLTPPIGVIVYAIASIAQDVPMTLIFLRLVPIFGGMLFCILLLVLFPGLATWLPSVLL